jgi:hypothetical protein
MPWIQVAVALFLVALGVAIGHTQLGLIRAGARASGKVVAFETVSYGSGSRAGRSAFHPVVEFSVDGHVVRFQDHIGSASAAGLHGAVDVLYDAAVPSTAMIDRPLWNWLPWAPTLAVGALLLVAGAMGLWRQRAGAVPSDAAANA